MCDLIVSSKSGFLAVCFFPTREKIHHFAMSSHAITCPNCKIASWETSDELNIKNIWPNFYDHYQKGYEHERSLGQIQCLKGYIPLPSSVATNNKPAPNASHHSVCMGLVSKY